MIIGALRLLSWCALAFVAIYLLADRIAWHTQVQPAIDAGAAEFVISPRYPVGARP